MSYRVVVADRIAAPGIALLENSDQIEVVDVVGKGPEALKNALSDAHALLVRSNTKVTADLIRRARDLRVVARAGTGVDSIDVQAATRLGIAVLNAPGANTVSAAEHTIALLLALVRRVPDAVASMRRGEWNRKQFQGTELRGKKIGIVGLGRVGMQVAVLARAFSMQVVGHDPYLSRERADEVGIHLLPLEELLATVDVVTLHVALTDQTRHLLNAERLALLKPGALLVNAARGNVVDEDAVIEAVESGKLGGVALDVFSTEPLRQDHPLRTSDKVILTPHLAASTAEAQERVAAEICAAIRDALVVGDISSAINVPGVSREALVRLGPTLDLARRVGRLATALTAEPVADIEVGYGGRDEDAPRPVQIAALEGVLASMGIGPVSLVNAQFLAEDRGLRVSRRVGPPERGFETTISVKLEGEGEPVEVVGALVGQGRGRIIRIGSFRVDVAPDGWLVVLRNYDVPGVIGRVGTILGGKGINIGTYHQARLEESEGGNGEALAVVAVDQPVHRSVLDELRAISDVVDVRFANLCNREG